MSESKRMAKFTPSPDLCSSCTRLLLSKLKEPVLLHESIFSLQRSSHSCSLCHLIWRSLTGFSTVKNGPRAMCNLLSLAIAKPGHPSAIWGRRQLVDFTSFGLNLAELHTAAENCPISFIEVMMIHTAVAVHLSEELRQSTAPRSERLNNAVWGLSCDPAVVREAGGCPYLWEYRKELHHVGRLNDYSSWGHGTVNEPYWWHLSTPMELFSSTRPSNLWWGKGMQGPYHRAVIQVSALDHRPEHDAAGPRSGTGVAGIVQRLKQEDNPILCGSPARLELAQHWPRNCLKWHSECMYWRESFSMPSRVIDVGPRDGSQEPFLYMPAPSHQDYYLCLSHRWGGAKVLQTVMGDPPGTPNGKTGAFSDFQSAIPMASMPKTFLDAIQVTRALGFRYIWIDSLCIVQDRSSDWEAEAKKMGSYYRNAHLTLVAGSAVSADSGLFFPIASPAVPSDLGSVSLELPNCRHHGAEPHTFRLFASEPQMVRTDYVDGPKPPCTLDDRAWVLQEEVLSARSLIFTGEGLYWQCTDSASEWHPHGAEYQYTRSLYAGSYGGELFISTHRTYAQQFRTLLLDDSGFLDSAPDPLVRALRSRIPVALDELLSEVAALRHARARAPPPNNISTSKEMQMARHPNILPEKHQDNPQDTGSPSRPPSPQPGLASDFPSGSLASQSMIWHHLVEDYSSRQLTRESDRLIAIQGLVSMLNQVRQDRYYAGLWGRTLREDILWKTDDGRTRMQHLCDCIPQKGWRIRELKPRRRPDDSEPTAPSWSWASADQGVKFVKLLEIYDTLEEFFRPLGVVMDDDTAVLNVRGRLTLEGVLRPVGLAASDDDLPYKEIRGSIYDPSDPLKKKLGYWQADRRTAQTGVMVCVPLIMMPSLNDSGERIKGTGSIECLVLEPTSNCRLRNKASKLLEFRRMGMATIKSEHRAFLGLGKSSKLKDRRSWDVRVKEWTKKPVVMDII